jgi:hypothetical protein
MPCSSSPASSVPRSRSDPSHEKAPHRGRGSAARDGRARTRFCAAEQGREAERPRTVARHGAPQPSGTARSCGALSVDRSRVSGAPGTRKLFAAASQPKALLAPRVLGAEPSRAAGLAFLERRGLASSLRLLRSRKPCSPHVSSVRSPLGRQVSCIWSAGTRKLFAAASQPKALLAPRVLGAEPSRAAGLAFLERRGRTRVTRRSRAAASSSFTARCDPRSPFVRLPPQSLRSHHSRSRSISVMPTSTVHLR